MRELQGVVADTREKDRDDSNSPAHHEAVKPGITSFPAVAELKSDEGYAASQDWLQTVTGLVGDVSDSASERWAGALGVLNVVGRAYGFGFARPQLIGFGLSQLFPLSCCRASGFMSIFGSVAY